MTLITEPGLTWQRVKMADGQRGASFTEYRCVEHPRLTRMVQRQNRDADFVEFYHVDGVGNYYHTPQQALVAMRSNP